MERMRDASDQTRFSRSSSLPLAAFAVASICFFLVASCSCCPLVTKEDRKILTRTDNGEVSAVDVDVDDGCNYRNSSYHLEFISMEPNSLFLPVFLHNDVVFYVQTGNGTVSWWIKKDYDVTVKETHLDVGCGDLYRIGRGSFFYIRTRSDPLWNKLRISALFVNHCMQEKADTPYSNAADLIRGFDVELLGAGFNVSENAVSRIIKPAEKPPPIIPYTAVAGDKSDDLKLLFNIHKKKPDIKNQHGWSSTSAVPGEESDVGGFMVNLTQGSMIAPHWNPMGSEISMVTEGEGMIQIVYPTSTSTSKTIGLFKVKVGDVFVVPRYHPMVQVSFRHSSLVLVGFTTVDPHSSSNNHPQFLAGTGSVFRMLDRQVLAMGFDVGSTTVDKIFSSVDDAVLLDCISCAEEMETKMKHDIEKRQKQEEKKRMEEARQREREKQEKRRREEEERKKEEVERKKREKRHKEEEEERKERQKRQKEEEERQKEEEEEEKERKEREMRQKEEEEEEEEEEERKERKKRQKEEESKEEKEKAKRRKEKEEESRREEEEDDKEEKEKEKRREEEGGWEGDRWQGDIYQ